MTTVTTDDVRRILTHSREQLSGNKKWCKGAFENGVAHCAVGQIATSAVALGFVNLVNGAHAPAIAGLGDNDYPWNNQYQLACERHLAAQVPDRVAGRLGWTKGTVDDGALVVDYNDTAWRRKGEILGLFDRAINAIGDNKAIALLEAK